MPIRHRKTRDIIPPITSAAEAVAWLKRWLTSPQALAHPYVVREQAFEIIVECEKRRA